MPGMQERQGSSGRKGLGVENDRHSNLSRRQL
jgi:hypothetical protein